MRMDAWYGPSVPTSPADYRNAALERIGDAHQLKRLERHPFAMYTAGVAVECVLRAFRHPDREHEAHHDVVAHLAACDRSISTRTSVRSSVRASYSS
jgi:hypothetical protein